MVLLVNMATPTDAVRHTETHVSAHVEGAEVGSGAGTLYVTENFVVWLDTSSEGLQLEYKQISLHAISRDLQAFPKEHLLLHYEGKLPGLSEQNGGTESEESDGGGMPDTESNTPLIEIRFVPENKDSLEAMFEALAQCQTLHPDDDCQLSEEEEFEDAEEETGAGDGIFHGEEGLAHLTEEGRQNLERFNQMLQAGQGDAEITVRTNQIHITNGNHEDVPQEDGQFQDAEDNMEQN